MNDEKSIKFIAKISKSGRKRLINIPSELLKELDKNTDYYKIYMIPVKFNDLERE